jgi:hypothetical protein
VVHHGVHLEAPGEISDPHEDPEETTDLREDPEETTDHPTTSTLEATLGSTLGGLPLPTKTNMSTDPCVEALQAHVLLLMVVPICEGDLLLLEVVVLKLLARLDVRTTADVTNTILTWREIIMVVPLPVGPFLEEGPGLVPDLIL